MAQDAPENAIVGNQTQVPLVQSALNFIRKSVPTLYNALNTGGMAPTSSFDENSQVKHKRAWNKIQNL